MIPKLIHLCWLSGDPYPPKIRRCIESWHKHLPDYEIILWDTKRFDMESAPWVKEAFEAKKYAFAADYIRFYALYHFGGIYLDSDVEVLKSFDPLLDLPYFAGAEKAGTIEAAVLGAEKGCDWIKHCLDYYEGRHFLRPDGSYDIRMLPDIMQSWIPESKQIIRLHKGGIETLHRKNLDEAVYILPSDYFSPKVFDSRRVLLTPETYAIHHYQTSWYSPQEFVYYRTQSMMIKLFGYKIIRGIQRLIRRK